MRRLVELAVDRIVAHIESLPSQPSVDVEGGVELARSLSEPLPETPTPYAQLLDLLFERAVPKSFNTAGPGYLAYIPGGGLVHTALADLIADAVNRYVGVWAAAPALVQLEANVGRWFCDVVGYPAGALGLLTSGGSLANFTAVVTARRERLPEDFLRGVLYASDQVHHSVQKAAMLAGFPPQNVHAVASDARFRLDLEALRSAIAADRAAGRTPFLVVGTAGTTNTGAVDDLAALADLAAAEGLWLHVDAAYGGFFLLTKRGRRIMRGIELVAEPELSLLAFRLRRPGLDEPALDALNRRLLDRVNARRRVYLTGTVAHGRFLCRICVLSFRTHLDRMRAAVEDIRAAVADVGA